MPDGNRNKRKTEGKYENEDYKHETFYDDIYIATVLAVLLLFSSRLSVNAAFSGYSVGLTLEELHTATIAGTVNEDAPMITFLTHGLGGGSGDWSNSMFMNEDNEEDGSSAFSYDSASIIEKIRNQIPSGIKLYEAIMSNLTKPYTLNPNYFTLREYVIIA